MLRNAKRSILCSLCSAASYVLHATCLSYGRRITSQAKSALLCFWHHASIHAESFVVGVGMSLDIFSCHASSRYSDGCRPTSLLKFIRNARRNIFTLYCTSSTLHVNTQPSYHCTRVERKHIVFLLV
jgi:hypothetical protein